MQYRVGYNDSMNKPNTISFSDPITPSEHFLYYLYNDPEFIAIRHDFYQEVGEINVGILQLAGGATDAKSEVALKKYVDIISRKFMVTEEVARKGLLHNKYLSSWSKDRTPHAEIKEGRVVINIGSKTRQSDIKAVWPYIQALQRELDDYEGKTYTKSSSLAYAIHRQIMAGATFTEIHRAYEYGHLEGYCGDNNLALSDFIKHYKQSVQGLVETPSYPKT